MEPVKIAQWKIETIKDWCADNLVAAGTCEPGTLAHDFHSNRAKVYQQVLDLIADKEAE